MIMIRVIKIPDVLFVTLLQCACRQILNSPWCAVCHRTKKHWAALVTLVTVSGFRCYINLLTIVLKVSAVFNTDIGLKSIADTDSDTEIYK